MSVITSLITSQKREPNGAPFPATAANNGLSVDGVSGKIVFGNSFVGGPGPAQLLNLREIDTNGNEIQLRDYSVSPDVSRLRIKSNLIEMREDQTDSLISIDTAATNTIKVSSISDPTAFGQVGVSSLLAKDSIDTATLLPAELSIERGGVSSFLSRDRLKFAGSGTIQIVRVGSLLSFNDSSDLMLGTINMAPLGGEIFFKTVTTRDAILLRTTVNLTDVSAASVGTLTNAPQAGNPLKWITILDNGVTRKIPTW